MKRADSRKCKSTAKETFANPVGPWLAANAIEYGATVITNEKSAPISKKDIKLADVCEKFYVKYMNDINFLRAIKFKIA